MWYRNTKLYHKVSMHMCQDRSVPKLPKLPILRDGHPSFVFSGFWPCTNVQRDVFEHAFNQFVGIHGNVMWYSMIVSYNTLTIRYYFYIEFSAKLYSPLIWCGFVNEELSEKAVLALHSAENQWDCSAESGWVTVWWKAIDLEIPFCRTLLLGWVWLLMLTVGSSKSLEIKPNCFLSSLLCFSWVKQQSNNGFPWILQQPQIPEGNQLSNLSLRQRIGQNGCHLCFREATKKQQAE